MSAFFASFTIAGIIYLCDGAEMYVCPSEIQSEDRDLSLLSLLLPHRAVKQDTAVAQLKGRSPREWHQVSLKGHRKGQNLQPGEGDTPLPSPSYLKKQRVSVSKTDLQALPGK